MRRISPKKIWLNCSKYHNKILNSEWYRIIFELQSSFVVFTNDFYKERGFRFQMLPLTTGSVSSPIGLGSDSLPVEISLFGVKTYLVDSMQFFLEFACRMNKSGNYYIAPSFRGEKADKRHLCQFFHSEAEIEGSLEDVMSLVEDYLLFLIKKYEKFHIGSIKKITKEINHITLFKNTLSKGLPTCSYEEAFNLLSEIEGCFTLEKGIKFITNKGENELIKHFGGAVWLMYPEHLAVPFYQSFKGEDKKYANCADLLLGMGETVGAGQRHLSADQTLKGLIYHHINPKEYAWYIDMKKNVPMQTSGFGLGIERFLLWLLKHDDIRDVQIIPRFNGVEHKF